jgi:hypothetical protein
VVPVTLKMMEVGVMTDIASVVSMERLARPTRKAG